MSEQLVTSPNSVPGGAYFGLRVPKLSPYNTVRGTPDSGVSPFSQDTGVYRSVDFEAPLPQSKLRLPPVAGNSSFNTYSSPEDLQRSSPPSKTESRKSSPHTEGRRALNFFLKLPQSLPRSRAKSERRSSSEKPETERPNDHERSSKRHRSSELSPANSEGESCTTKQGKIPAIKALPPPVPRQLTHSIGYGRKITIATAFEESTPIPPSNLSQNTSPPLNQNQNQSHSPLPNLSQSQSLEQRSARKGLYQRYKKYITSSNPSDRAQKHDRHSIPLFAERNRIQSTLDRTSSLLGPSAAEGVTPSGSDSGTTQSGKSGSSHSAKPFSLSWKKQGDISNSSSVIALKRRVEPSSTPEEDSTYLGSDMQRYMKVEISNPGMPTYLPSEAQKIGTPPEPVGGEGFTHHRRVFFFDYSGPQDSTVGESCDRELGRTRDGGQAEDDFLPKGTRARKYSETGWYTLQMDLMDMKVEEEKRRGQLDIHIPDHLSTSPLCPRNVRNELTHGKGTCVMHGRNPTSFGSLENESD